MRKAPSNTRVIPDPSRRRFLQGLAAGGVLMGLSPWTKAGWAGQVTTTATGMAPVLSGTEFDLIVAETAVNYTGSPRMATTINGSIPSPILRWREGDTVTIRVTNRLNTSTSIHWHGIILPYQMDGVPGISFAGIPPGETFTYRFKVEQAGTYWYHSHSGFQEQTGMYGTIIVEPRDGEHIRADRDYVVQLSDWTDEDPMQVFAKLKKQSDYYNFNAPTAMDFFRDASDRGLGKAMERRRMWNQMRMSPTDLADISAHSYTYLMNGTTPAGNWTGLFNPGERVRLRFISSGTQSFFDVRIPGLKMTVVHVDGQDIEPVTVDEFRCGPGETYDVLVTPQDDAYTIFAQSMDRTGYARGTLATRADLTAPIPELDEPEWLSMSDMMGAMAQGGAMGGMGGMNHNGHSMSGSMNKNATPVRHAKTEYGPSVDMRVDMPRTNLDDPGIGLRNNGRRVLTYADIKTPGEPVDPRDPGRDIELHLTGNMERYTWSLDGLEFGKSTPIHFRHGERLRVILHNDTMMTHPMHLHGMWSDMEDADGEFLARRHTISVQPAQRVSFRVTADALGRWAWHCHLLYHMDAGMFREVIVT
ncbi:MAG: copper resistance system multicopper oxidase [Gammaproteobacteria bacterium]|nr:copper resistance system multicopper oxidase [Gammaproteobacteria bacterium]MCF6260236.1 copper resistance system multicopper oxidase [Gammaproteobacteria bacterium]